MGIFKVYFYSYKINNLQFFIKKNRRNPELDFVYFKHYAILDDLIVFAQPFVQLYK